MTVEVKILRDGDAAILANVAPGVFDDPLDTAATHSVAFKDLRTTSCSERPIIYSIIYGILVYIFMNYIVIPLSATRRPPFLLSWVVCSVIVHAFLIGVPAALFARKAQR